jgi:acetyl esterase/lipase
MKPDWVIQATRCIPNQSQARTFCIAGKQTQPDMRKTILLFTCLLLVSGVHSQKWVAQTFAIQTTVDVAYGTATDFAGNLRILRMDITVPTDDTPPPCGRPLLLAIHGGSFLAGDKSEGTLQAWMKDFAKRGYTTASVNYRLGMFQTNAEVHCNVTQLFNTPWDCSNMADTAEWYRGAYRGMQDVRGAIRYFVNNRSIYNIDPQNVFLVGESAGGFIALSATFLDTLPEKPAAAYGLPDVLPPNKIYESPCVQQFKWDTTIASMQLQRPDLGPLEGTLNPSTVPYTIRGVGNFYGGLFGDLFSQNTYVLPPALYLFHQPNDLIVPFNQARVLAGLSECFTGLGCASIINRPIVSGSTGIKTRIDQLKSAGKQVPEYVFDKTNNTADCAAQIFNPALTGHAIDNYMQRTTTMAQLFASRIAACVSSTTRPEESALRLAVYPNPAQDIFRIVLQIPVAGKYHCTMRDQRGAVVVDQPVFWDIGQQSLEMNCSVTAGLYYLMVWGEQGGYEVIKLVKTK